MPLSDSPLFKKIQKRWVFRLFLFKKLKAASFARLQLLKISNHECSIALPFKKRNLNPFGSSYFASQSMAAEMSTGLPAFLLKHKRNVSMLVTNMEAHFHRTGRSRITFTCSELEKIEAAMNKCLANPEGEPESIKVKTEGFDQSGELVSEFYFYWSFKKRQ